MPRWRRISRALTKSFSSQGLPITEKADHPQASAPDGCSSSLGRSNPGAKPWRRKMAAYGPLQRVRATFCIYVEESGIDFTSAGNAWCRPCRTRQAGILSFKNQDKVTNMKRTTAKRLSLTVLATTLALATVAAGADYKVTRTWKLGGDGGWDYLTVDSAGHRLFISRATRVMVIDSESGKQIGEIPDTPGVHGIALAPELGRGFTSNGREDTVSVFDLKSLAVEKKIKVGS